MSSKISIPLVVAITVVSVVVTEGTEIWFWCCVSTSLGKTGLQRVELIKWLNSSKRLEVRKIIPYGYVFF